MLTAAILVLLLLALAHSHDKRRQLARTVSELDAQLTASEHARLLWEARATRLNYERAQRAGGAR